MVMFAFSFMQFYKCILVHWLWKAVLSDQVTVGSSGELFLVGEMFAWRAALRTMFMMLAFESLKDWKRLFQYSLRSLSSSWHLERKSINCSSIEVFMDQCGQPSLVWLRRGLRWSPMCVRFVVALRSWVFITSSPGRVVVRSEALVADRGLAWDWWLRTHPVLVEPERSVAWIWDLTSACYPDGKI